MAAIAEAKTNVRPQLREMANEILAWFVAHAEADWRAVLARGLDTDKEVETNAARVHRALKGMNRSEPLGAVLGGSNTLLKDHMGLDGEVGLEAMAALKEAGRIQQAGRGRGRAIIVLSDEPLDTADSHTQTTTPQPLSADEVLVSPTVIDDPQQAPDEQPDEVASIPADNLPALLAAARDVYRGMTREVNELRRDLRRSETSREELVTEVAELSARCTALQEQLDEQAVRTWR